MLAHVTRLVSLAIMRRFRLWLALLLSLVLFGIAPASAVAATRVKWQHVQVRKGKDAKRVAKRLRRYLTRKSKRAKWGKHKRLTLNARVKKLHWESRGDVMLIHVTVVGRIAGGKTVRSSIRLGGHPNEKRKLEESALKIVAAGLVTRLSNITRKSLPHTAPTKKE